MSNQTHHSTVSADIRRLLEKADLGGMNTDFFLKATFVSDLAVYVQRKEAEAYQRGLYNNSPRPTLL